MSAHPTLPPEVRAMLDALLPGVRAALGDFDPETSDLDFLAVTARSVSETQYAALTELHARLATLPNRYAYHLEGSYIDRAALRQFGPHERRHPTVGPDWVFGWGDHGGNWMLERWIVRERGVVLLGPDPRTLIAPISPGDLRDGVREELRSWAAQPGEPAWLLRRRYQAFAVETMCRALFTLHAGELLSKPRAVAWALDVLPEVWRNLVERSREWRRDDTPDPTTLPDVMRFVRWTAAEGETAVRDL